MSKSDSKIEISQKELDDLLENKRYAQKVKDRQKNYSRIRNARLVIMYNRAKEMNVPEPTEEEINEYMNK